jgi:hypothetical protein
MRYLVLQFLLLSTLSFAKYLREIIRAFRKNPEALAPLIGQNRVGRFQVECRVLHGKTVVGVGSVGLEILFTGRFSDTLGTKK